MTYVYCMYALGTEAEVLEAAGPALRHQVREHLARPRRHCQDRRWRPGAPAFPVLCLAAMPYCRLLLAIDILHSNRPWLPWAEHTPASRLNWTKHLPA